MTREQLIIENEALHGLLAHACEALEMLEAFVPEDAPEAMRSLAGDVLAQIKEGVVP